MVDKNKIIPAQNKGLFQDLIGHIKLIWRLMNDRRINFFLKFLPVGALIYLVLPIDLVPGLALPVIGALDDAAILWIGTTLFLNLCPEEIVREHQDALQKVIPATWKDADVNEPERTDIVDVTARDGEEKQ